MLMLILYTRFFCRSIVCFIFRIGMTMSSKHHPNVRDHKGTYKDWPEVSASRQLASTKKQNTNKDQAWNHHPHHSFTSSIFVMVVHRFNYYLLIRLELCIHTK